VSEPLKSGDELAERVARLILLAARELEGAGYVSEALDYLEFVNARLRHVQLIDADGALAAD
jgi:hypothetical protein